MRNHHLKIQSWDDVEKYKPEVLPYLEWDVKGLKELFEVFNDMIYEIKQTNISDYITLSHLAYEIWTSMLNNYIEIPNDLEKYELLNKQHMVEDVIHYKRVQKETLWRCS